MKTFPAHRILQFDRQIPSSKKTCFVRSDLAKTIAFALASTLSALVLLAAQASAASFSFSTGDPDGKIATLSRPTIGPLIQTETADDFILPETTLIRLATFTGLIPSDASLSSILNVEVEIYHVFPNDSADPPSGRVPTRNNSPGDVEIDEATRDGADGSLSFKATLLNPSFDVANSVLAGINPIPNQFTGGEGPVTGQEVTISLIFNPPIDLPAGHYFFRPEVELSSGDFLWLSAPKPIVAPGTPFAPDLQSWIRNDDLAPDWLRIGTDITQQGPFNAAFSLSTDADEDGIADSADLCPDTAAGAAVGADGCSIDQLVPCDGPATGGTWKNHGEYVSAVTQAAAAFQAQGLISESQRGAIVASAAKSNCGSKAK